MANRGVAPVDTETAVGQLRGNVGDTEYTEFDPVEPGFGAYKFFGDAELSTFLTLVTDSVTRATGLAYMQLAASAALTSVVIGTDDLRVDTTARGKTLVEIAQSYFRQADEEDARLASDFFEVVPFVGGYASTVLP